MRSNFTKLVLINYSYLIIAEILFKFIILQNIDVGILYTIIFTFPFAILFSGIESLFKGIPRIIWNIISSILFIFIFCGETVYYSFYKTICGISGILYGGQVAAFYTAIINHIKINIVLLSIIVVLTILVSILKTKKVNNIKNYSKIFIVLLISSVTLCLSSLEIYKNVENSSNDLFYNTNDLMQSTNRFGILSGVSIDAFKIFTDFNEVLDLKYDFKFEAKEDVEYNSLDIDFDKLIENENDDTIKAMHTYFKNEVPTEKNEYTGLFSGKNLIFIVAEGFSPIAVNEEYTPTLYKMVNSSFVFNNYYQPIYGCSTSDGEFINQLSILPGVRLCSMRATEDVYLPYSVGNIMKNYGYNSYGFHGWTYSYYGRDKTMPNLGYEYYGFDRFNTGYDKALPNIKNQWPTSDIEVMNSSYPIIDKTKPFVAYYMSISGHLEYNFVGGNAMASKNKNLVSNLNAKDSIKAYIATQIEFDRSIEILLQNLEKDGILDDTVIVISADHYPYGLTNEDIAEYTDWMKNPNFDLYKNNLIIYNSKVDTTEINKYASSLDVLPTILNLFGIKYDSRLLIGKDIFSESDDLIIFNNKSWITSKGRYDYMKKKFESFTDEQVDQEYISEINKIVDYKFRMSKLLISKDYYRTLGGL